MELLDIGPKGYTSIKFDWYVIQDYLSRPGNPCSFQEALDFWVSLSYEGRVECSKVIFEFLTKSTGTYPTVG